jgi:aminoglycoside phosphotransferase
MMEAGAEREVTSLEEALRYSHDLPVESCVPPQCVREGVELTRERAIERKIFDRYRRQFPRPE